MDQRTIEDLLALIGSGSVTRAAHLRNVSQSAYSRRLRAIEARLGIELFDRGKRREAVSPALQARRPELEAALVYLRRLASDLAADSGADVAPVELGIAAVHGLASRTLPIAVAALPAGRVQVRLRAANRDVCFSHLITEQVSVIAVYETRTDRLRAPPELIERHVLGTDWMVPLCAAAQAAGIARAMASGASLPLVAYPGDTFLGQLLSADILRRSPHAYRATLTAGSTDVVRNAAGAGLGVAWMPLSSAVEQVLDGSLHILDGDNFPRLPLEVSLLRLKGSSADPISTALQHLSASIMRTLERSRGLIR